MILILLECKITIFYRISQLNIFLFTHGLLRRFASRNDGLPYFITIILVATP